MGTATYASIATSIIVAAVILGAGIFPLIDNLTAGETIEVSNEGASWIRMAYVTDQSDYSAEYSLGEDGITVAGQTGEYGDMILYADSKNTLCIIDDQIVRITGNEYTIYGDDVETITVSRTNGVVSFDDYVASESVEWAYVPIEGGAYGSFAPDTLPLNRYNSALAAVGGFAGIYAYNENLTYDAGLVMDADVTNTVINSVKWALPAVEPEPLDIDPLDIDPSTLTPIDIDPINPFQPSENQIMGVPTPTYTDGVWGYDLETVGGVQKAKIVSYSGAGGGTITIPATVGGYDVYSVGSGTYPNYSVFDVSITSTSLIISNGIVKINESAFVNCINLTGSLTLPNTMTEIGENAFRGCSGLTGTLTIPSSVTILNRGSFYGCTGFSALVLNEGLTKILTGSAGTPNGCFTGCTGFTGTLTLPSTLTHIDNSAFRGCTGFTSLVLNSTPTLQSVTDKNNGIFSGCTGLTGTITLPNGWTLGGADFYGCTGITGIVLPSGMTTIPTRAFEGCTSIASLSIPSTVTTIRNYAFSGCSGITGTLTLPTGLTTIGIGAFTNCSGFTSLVIPDTITTIEAQTFMSCTGFTGELSIPDSVTTIGVSAFNGCTGFTGIHIGSGVTTIGGTAFEQCTGLTGSLVIPSNVKSIAYGAFNRCTGFTGLVLNEGLQSLANTSNTSRGAFERCTNMTGILVIPSTVQDIGIGTFAHTHFTSLIVKSNVIPTVGNAYATKPFEDTYISQVLNFSENEWTATSYGLNAEEVRSDIEADSYLSVVHVTESTTKEGAVFDIVGIIPLALVAGFLLIAVWVFFKK